MRPRRFYGQMIMTSSALFRYIFFVGVCGSVPVFCVSAVSSHIETERSLFCFFAPEPFQSHKLSSLSHWQPELDNERIAYSGRTNRRKLHCVCSVSAASLQTRVLSLLVLKCAAKTLFSLHKSCPHSRGEIYIKRIIPSQSDHHRPWEEKCSPVTRTQENILM